MPNDAVLPEIPDAITPPDSPAIVGPTLGASDFDKLVVDRLNDFDQFKKGTKALSLRNLERKNGVLTSKNQDAFLKRFDEVYGERSNGMRKKRILKICRDHPALIDINPDVMWKRIVYFEKIYGIARL